MQSDAAPAIATGAQHILVVEDEVLVRMMVSDELRDAGYKVIEATNAEEAVDILGSGVDIDLVFSDVRMPGRLDGIGLLVYIANAFPLLPVIITSGHLASEQAFASGAAGFLPKPYSFEQIRALVERKLAPQA